MCRLFGVFSSDPLDASFYLSDAPQSLRVQSDVDKKRKQGDGWGIGWFASQQPQIFKSPRPLYADAVRLRQAARRARGNNLVGHVRWASNPMKLPKRELIGMAHTQPFQYGRWIFAHNGTLYIPREVKAALGSWAKFVKGQNDSEVLFYWLLKTVIHGSKESQWVPKLRASIKGLHRIWAGCKALYPLYKYPYHGLNWVLTNGRVMLAFCYVDPRGFDKAKALCRPGQPYYQLQVQQTENAVTVASEPLTHEINWQPLGHGRLLVVHPRGRSMKSKIVKVL